MYGTGRTIDGPQAGAYVPFHGVPRYGFAIELDRSIPGGLFRSPRRVTDIYRVSRDQSGSNPAELSFIGTVDRTPRRAY